MLVLKNQEYAMVPAVATCMNCHTVARKDRPDIIKLAEYYRDGKPLRWKRIHKVPDYAYFNHSVHVNKGIDCTACHGQISSNGKSWTDEFVYNGKLFELS